MEKFDLDDQQEVHFEIPEGEPEGYTDEGALAGGAPEDSVDEPADDEQFAFLKEVIGENYADDPRNTYKLSTDDNNWPKYEFPYGNKTMRVQHDVMGTLWHVDFVEGGNVPQELSGKFTTDRDAIKAVEIYILQNK